MKPDPADQIIERLSTADSSTAEGRKLFVSALSSRYNRVIVKAAKILANLRAAAFAPQLADALNRLLTKADGSDKGCAAMLALARALVELDHDVPELFLRGMKYIQKEASWGPPVDTAAELRGICAMGLINSIWTAKHKPLVDLLVDPEWPARAGAVRALAALGTEAARLVLYLKARIGDEQPEVLSTCLEALLAGEGGAALPLVTDIAANAHTEAREAAILALGASRRDDAIAWLIERCGETVRADDRKALYLALSSSRTEPGLEYLLGLLRTGNATTLAAVQEALGLHGRDPQFRERIDAALAARS